MENIKLYGINLAALLLTSVKDILPELQATSLLLAIIYTIIQIIQKLWHK